MSVARRPASTPARARAQRVVAPCPVMPLQNGATNAGDDPDAFMSIEPQEQSPRAPKRRPYEAPNTGLQAGGVGSLD
eukprot:5061366-Lingulodinium_polyedra.AAC.1